MVEVVVQGVVMIGSVQFAFVHPSKIGTVTYSCERKVSNRESGWEITCICMH